ncbi:MAG: YidC/Oxa1 family membrane protein insertase [Spirochaetaceae bacterium]|jgi:YidC/Oxa1 family membrane protein insertase|nr:YidC/Oxa1 family membrane protein insertase [Spirochaetaceae bacterium]
MTAAGFFYTLLIWPMRAFIEFLFVFFSRTFYDTGLGIVFLSLAVNVLLLPLYTVAERWQKEEREMQARMKEKLFSIRAVFRGDERQMIISAYYRQMHYSPLFALKASAGFLLQIPAFFAAYQFLSHTSSLAGEQFLFLRDLGEADGLLRAGGGAFNVMPVIMTAVNLVSASVYTKGQSLREKLQLAGMALLFLVLLYRSPSGLVLYWTANNVFSLGKNLALAKLKRPALALQVLTSAFALVLLGGALSGTFDVDRYRFLFAAAGALLLAAPFVWKALIRHAERLPSQGALYASSFILLGLLLGLHIPAQVIASSVSDFDGPWGFLLRTFTQSLALTAGIPLLLWAFAGTVLRKLLAPLASMLALSSLICVFALSASYGVMTNSFKFEDPQLISRAFPLWVSGAALLASAAVPAVFTLLKKQHILSLLYNAAAAALLIFGIINMTALGAEARTLAALRDGGPAQAAGEAVFPLTREGNNTFIMFLDRAVGTAMHKTLEKMPDLEEALDGFVWYPNTLSFGHCTVTGLPAMMGGYDYTPAAMDSRRDVPLRDKVNEALTLLPHIAGEAGVRVSITDPSMANLQLVPDLSVFQGIPNVTAQNLDGRFNKRFLAEFPQEEESALAGFDFDILFRYGLFRIAPPALRYGIHYKGLWWRDGASNAYGRGVTEYASLYYLGDVCAADDGGDTLNIFMNETPHEPGAYDAGLLPRPGVIRYSDEELAYFGSGETASYMYTFMAAMRALSRWLETLKRLGVYDNTRIIIVSDHGDSQNAAPFESGMEAYNPLLLVKERNSRGPLAVSPDFMTNADVPSLALADMANPVNPSLSRPVNSAAKEVPLTVSQAVSFQPRRHGPYVFSLSGTRKLLAKNIFSAASWGPWEEVSP